MNVAAIISPASSVASLPSPKKAQTKTKTAAAKGAVAKRSAPTHPSTSIMVTSAIKELKERKGSSLSAIKKYLAANYQIDPVKTAPYIRKFLSASVLNGTIIQTKGHFKLAVAEVKPKKAVVVKKPIAKKVKPATAGTPKKKKKAAATAVKSKTTSNEPAAKKLKKSLTKSAPKVTTAVVKSKKTPVKSTKSKAPKKPLTKKPANLKKK